ncbi:MAG: tetratricopeptide repeat protein [Bacteroidales bacterium]|jgi:tetratricopeptide (TPR) repeat protein|nr:tetratricopeptide repeat protein [Bacteroidales bacterium]
MKLKAIIITLFIATFFTGLQAQSLKSAGKTYYKANDLLAEGDTLKAIESYQECADMSAELGELGECIKLKAETKLSNLYLNEAIKEYYKKNYDGSLQILEKVEDYASFIDDPKISSDLSKYKAQNYLGKGDQLYQRRKYESAVEMYRAALEVDTEFARAYYGLVLTYAKLEDSEMMEEAEKNVRQYSSDEDLKDKARNAVASYYKELCAEAMTDKKYNIVTMMASKSLVYNSKDPEVYYYLARSSNEKEDWVSAEKAASRAISLKGDDMMSYYFELGRAYDGIGNQEKACEAYSKITEGKYQVNAKNRTIELNCQ